MMQFLTEGVADTFDVWLGKYLRASGTHTAGGAEVFITFIPGSRMSSLYINFTLVDD